MKNHHTKGYFMLIVGSKALIHNFPSIDREAKDIDLIAWESNISYLKNALNPKSIKFGKGIVSFIDINKIGFYNTKNVEILIADNSVALQSYLIYEKEKGKVGSGLHYASSETLLSLKRSHIHFPIYFNKHISDYCFLMDQLKIDVLSDITKIHYKEIENRIGKLKTPSLNKSTKDFFGQSDEFVKSYFIHDHIHEAMAHHDRPLYLNMQYDKTMAKCEKELWDKFTFEDKCKCVLEEAYVIALERKVLPSIFGGYRWVNHTDAFNWALMRICTTLCSGWFRQFATDNYFKIKDYFNSDYVVNFLQKYNDNKICRI